MKRIAIIILTVLAFAATSYAGEIGVIKEFKMLRPALNKFKVDPRSFTNTVLDDEAVISVVRDGVLYVYDPVGQVVRWKWDFNDAHMEVNLFGFVPFSGVLHAIVTGVTGGLATPGVINWVINTATNQIEYEGPGRIVAILQLPSRGPVVLSYIEQENFYKVIGEVPGSSLAHAGSNDFQQRVFSHSADYRLDLKFQADPGLRLAYDPDLFDPPGDTDLDGDGYLDIPALKVESGQPEGVVVRGGDSLEVIWQFPFPEEHKANILKGFHGFVDANGDGQKEAIVGDNLAVTLDGTVHTIANDFQILDVNDIDNDGLEDIIGLNTIDSTVVVYGIRKPTAVADYDPGAIHFRLFQNYPNPFNPSTTITYSVAQPGNVELAIFNPLGQAVRTLVNERKPAGEYNLSWDGRDDAGQLLSSGPYFYRLKVGDAVETRRLLFLK